MIENFLHVSTVSMYGTVIIMHDKIIMMRG